MTVAATRPRISVFESSYVGGGDELVNLSRVNRLLYFRHTKTASIEIEEPAGQAVIDRLKASGDSANSWSFHLPAAQQDPDETPPPRVRAPSELLVQDKDAKAIESALRLLERKTNQEFVNKGLWTLYLGLGMLDWVDPDDDKLVTARSSSCRFRSRARASSSRSTCGGPRTIPWSTRP